MDSKKTCIILEFLEAYNEHFREQLCFLSEKYEKVICDDVKWLLDSLPVEQKLIMRGASIETKRIALFLQQGVANITVSQLIEETPEELSGRMKQCCDCMNDYVQKIKTYNDDITDIVERKFTIQSNKFQKMGIVPSNTYSVKGAKISDCISKGTIGKG